MYVCMNVCYSSVKYTSVKFTRLACMYFRSIITMCAIDWCLEIKYNYYGEIDYKNKGMLKNCM